MIHSTSVSSFTTNAIKIGLSPVGSAFPLTGCNNVQLERPSNSSKSRTEQNPNANSLAISTPYGRGCGCGCGCGCGRRQFIETMAAGAALLTALPSAASDRVPDISTAMLNRIHPPRPDWYEEFYASAMNNCMKSYEAEISSCKSQLFNELRRKKAKEVLEIGIGTGPNLKYYAGDTGMHVFGVDPNKKMEKYAKKAAEAAGLEQTSFEFIQAIGEALPLSDASIDAVIGTLVLCSVKDVKLTLREVKRVLKPGGLYLFVEHVGAEDGTFIRYVQNVLDPLQQILADGCHLTRETAKHIAHAGFVHVDSNMAFVSNASIINPHVYGIAYK
ncbi:hypothetical protein Nepgr_003579 [Nepenthes gracilis]|uniref:Methyltransferase type 11 domain-containing protein n=1 Tax=Nepenthes gracilis TaxID=150966 RepID=A0AAD3XE10_NEPGR|nr:hypothetical protein Nepgr_003579 [Nepenthes gracilis]